MKTAKKIASLLLALVMVACLATTAFAADAVLSDHTYTAYQIFSGTQAKEDNEGKLASIEWGTGVNKDTILGPIQSDETIGDLFKDCKTATDVANVLANYADKPEVANAFAAVIDANKSGTGTIVTNGTELSAGYYLIVDTTDFAEGATDTVKNLSLLQLTQKGEFTIENKTDVPEVQKKVKDINDSDANSTTDWQDSADYDIGDKIPFQLKGTVASDYDNYEKYYFAFHDDESEGLDVDISSIEVFVDGTKITGGFEIETTGLSDNCDFEIVFADLKSISSVKAGSAITVEYQSTLNEKAEIGPKGNPNTVQLEYSNNSNSGGDGETGKTPKDKVIVFTYELDVSKVDQENAPLKGAGFTLYKYTINGVERTDEKGETITSEGVPVMTDGWVAVGGEVKGEDLTTFVFKGLDDGKYKLVETTIPAGYNKADEVEFTITAEHDETSEDPKLTALAVTVSSISADVNSGVLITAVVNKAGTTLPETGGMGTTLFYVVGGIMVAAAVVLLVTKRRMNTAE